MNTFSERLKETLRKKGISQSELSRRINKSQDAINSYCTGKSKPSVKVFILICKELRVKADYLLGLID